ncbi:hypothetical protein [Metabacillus litoralis]|nr:hypothetical protein [Metabacillus litoralis]
MTETKNADLKRIKEFENNNKTPPSWSYLATNLKLAYINLFGK